MNDRLQAIYQYRELSDTIATAGQPSAAQLKDVAQAGFEVVINLGLANADYSLEDEGTLAESLGVSYEHIPVAWERPTQADLDRFFHIMAKHEGKMVFIHCAANKRVSVFMALLRILQESWSRDDAIASLCRAWVPNVIWEGFIDSVLSSRGKS